MVGLRAHTTYDALDCRNDPENLLAAGASVAPVPLLRPVGFVEYPARPMTPG